MVRNRNETTVKESDKKEGWYDGKPKLKWKSYKTNCVIVPCDVGEFVKEYLENSELEYYPNVDINGLRFYYYLPEENLVLDYIENGETEKGREDKKMRYDFCKKHKIRRITITKYNYKNSLNKIYES